MSIWSAEIKELERLYESFKGQLPVLEKELERLLKTDDENIILVYSRRCLEVIITDLCECELKRPRKTEPLKGIIEKLHKEQKVPSNIITSMDHLNSLSAYGAHPKEFDPEQVKPVLNNLDIIIKWYLKYKDTKTIQKEEAEELKDKIKVSEDTLGHTHKPKKRLILLLSGAALVVVIFIIALFVFNIIGDGNKNKKLEKSIAVLPFRNDSPEDSTQYFMDGVMEELLNKLQLIESLRVIGRTSVEQFRGQDKSIQEIAKELGVNYIVEGSGQKSGNSLRMRVQLLTAKNERHLWGDSFEQENLEMNDYFKAQSSFAEAIAKELNAALSAQEEELINKVPSVNLEAYDAYLKSNWAGDLGPEALLKAKDYLEDAIKKAPDWAPLYEAKAIMWLSMSSMGIESPEIANPHVYENLNKALELDPEVEGAHYIRAFMAWTFEWDWEKAETEFLNAIAINPNNPLSRLHYSLMLYALQRTEEARTQAELGNKLDPLNPIIQSVYAAALIMGGDCKSAISVLTPLLEIDPDNVLANAQMVAAAMQCGDLDMAFKTDISLLKKAFYSLTQADMNEIQKIYDEKGYYAANMKIIRKLEILAEKEYVPNNEFAFRYYFINNDEKAMDWLEKAFEAHENIVSINTRYFDLTRLYNNPRFIEILNKMNLPLPKTD